MTKQKPVYINEDVHKKIKMIAFKHDIPIQRIASALCEFCLNDEEVLKKVLEKLKI